VSRLLVHASGTAAPARVSHYNGVVAKERPAARCCGRYAHSGPCIRRKVRHSSAQGQCKNNKKSGSTPTQQGGLIEDPALSADILGSTSRQIALVIEGARAGAT